MKNQKKYFLNKECFCQDIDDSMFILNSKTGQYHEINKPGSSIIKLLDSEILTLDKIVHLVNQDKNKLSKHVVVKFLEKLLEREIIGFTE